MDRPNILLITTDQQRFDTINALGNPHIYTPHLNWLADEGLTFTRCYTDCPICMPARATIMTGRHGYNNGLVTNSHTVRPMEQFPTLPGLLTAHGYQTRAQGKMHFEPMRANYGFEHMELPMDYYREMHRTFVDGLPKEHGVGENEMVPVISTVKAERSLTHWTVQRSIDFLETRDDTRPFFLWTSFTKPHPPFDPCAEYWDLYKHKDVPSPIRGDWSKNPGDVPTGYLASTWCLNHADRMSDEELQDAKRAYYACITQIDYNLGLLFSRLRELDLFDKTWIIFTSDHGEMLGDHHMGAKCVSLEGAAHVPMLIRPPFGGWEKKNDWQGTRSDATVCLADILPTICNIAGIPVPDGADGVDMLAEKDAAPESRTLFLNQGDKDFGVVKGSIKYTWCQLGGDELLFDLANDPYEQKNLAADPGSKDMLESCRKEFAAWLAEKNPDLVKNGELQSDPAPKTRRDVGQWPGYHTTVFPCDVLH